MKTFNKSTILFTIFLLFITSISFAQGDFGLPGSEEGGGTGIDAPIDFLIYFGIAIGSIFGYNKFKSKD